MGCQGLQGLWTTDWRVYLSLSIDIEAELQSLAPEGKLLLIIFVDVD